jgi:hypothetical protein
MIRRAGIGLFLATITTLTQVDHSRSCRSNRAAAHPPHTIGLAALRRTAHQGIIPVEALIAVMPVAMTPRVRDPRTTSTTTRATITVADGTCAAAVTLGRG